MSYAAPTRWKHGDTPTAALMQPYSDDLEALHAIVGDAPRNYAVLWSFDNVDPDFAGSDFYFVHKRRWLIYRGDGELVDPSGAGTTITLSGSGTALLAYDLDGVDWMTPGKLYQCKDCVFALENSVTTGVSAIA